jgi:hypothetical protein
MGAIFTNFTNFLAIFYHIAAEAWWMAKRLATLLATHVTWVRFPVLTRPLFIVEKEAIFFNPVSGGTFSSTAIEIKKWVKKIGVAQAKVSHIMRPGIA